MTKAPKIKVTKDGPYLITGGIPLLRMIIDTDNYGDPLSWREIERYPQLESYTLCRCGKSLSKLFCDGNHKLQGFNGTETANNKPYIENVKEYIGPELKLTDKKELCIHAGFCDRDAGTWNLTVQSDRPGFKEIAIEEIANCPSGRLVIWDKQGNMIEPDYDPSIVITEYHDGSPGPLWIRGKVEVKSADGITYEKRNRVTLCNCGKSKNKPFCDCSHFNK